jgi:hypothetical protein
MPMFKTYLYKDSKRSPNQKRKPISQERLFQFNYDESALPYFEICPAKLLADSRFVGISRQDQGDYLRLVMLLWLDKGRQVRCSNAIAQNMGMEPCEWDALERRLLDAKLLEISPSGPYIIQASLREQYLMNRQANDNKKHIKSSSVLSDASAS